MSDPRPPRYLKPMNKFMMAVQKLGIPTGPAMVLTVPGRKTGKPRSTPMTPFTYDGGLYTVRAIPARTGRPTPGPQVPAPCRADAGRDRSRSSNWRRRVTAGTAGLPGQGPRRRRLRQALRPGPTAPRRVRGLGRQFTVFRFDPGELAGDAGRRRGTEMSPEPVRTWTLNVSSPSAGPPDCYRLLRLRRNVSRSSRAAVPSSTPTPMSPLPVCTDTPPMTAAVW